MVLIEFRIQIKHWSDYRLLLFAIVVFLGIQFELVHGNTKDEGILQIQYDGQKGYVCDLFKSKVMPKVACHSLGYIDGLSTLPQSTPTTAVSREFQVLFNVVLCHGDEDSIARCRNDGFRAGIQPNPLHRMCIRKKSLLSVHCFHQHVGKTIVQPSKLTPVL